MTWYNPTTWFKRKPKPKGGTFIDVILDYGFGNIAADKAGMKHVLHLTDIPLSMAPRFINGKAIDWHTVPAKWRHEMEINEFHAVTWDELKQYLRDI